MFVLSLVRHQLLSHFLRHLDRVYAKSTVKRFCWMKMSASAGSASHETFLSLHSCWWSDKFPCRSIEVNYLPRSVTTSSFQTLHTCDDGKKVQVQRVKVEKLRTPISGALRLHRKLNFFSPTHYRWISRQIALPCSESLRSEVFSVIFQDFAMRWSLGSEWMWRSPLHKSCEAGLHS